MYVITINIYKKSSENVYFENRPNKEEISNTFYLILEKSTKKNRPPTHLC